MPETGGLVVGSHRFFEIDFRIRIRRHNFRPPPPPVSRTVPRQSEDGGRGIGRGRGEGMGGGRIKVESDIPRVAFSVTRFPRLAIAADRP